MRGTYVPVGGEVAEALVELDEGAPDHLLRVPELRLADAAPPHAAVGVALLGAAGLGGGELVPQDVRQRGDRAGGVRQGDVDVEALPPAAARRPPERSRTF